mmetsp:Transcript_44926/g.105022  ORF Transcript_44926/g.105022 Transcript_44926/m.105022 type:complete len:459 (-) Transcript_44926:298-1674(-)
MHAVILTYEDRNLQRRSPETALRILVQHHVRHLPGFVGRVEAVNKSLAKSLRQIIPGRVVDGFLLGTLLQTSPELLHLPQSRSIGVNVRIWEESKRPCDGQCDGVASYTHVLLSFQDCVEHRCHRSAGQTSWMHLQVWFIRQDQGFQSRMVALERVDGETHQEILVKVEICLIEAVPVVDQAVVRALCEAKVAHSCNDINPLLICQVQEGPVARVCIVSIHSDGVSSQLLDQLQVAAAPIGPHRSSDVCHVIVTVDGGPRLLHGRWPIRHTLHRLIRRIEHFGRLEVLVVHRTWFGTGDLVDLVYKLLKLLKAGCSCMKTSVLLGIGVNVVMHRPVHGFPAKVIHLGRATNIAARQLAEAFLCLAYSVLGRVSRNAQAFASHALRQSTTGRTTEEMASATGVMTLDVVGDWRAFVCFLVVVIVLPADASKVMAFCWAKRNFVTVGPETGTAGLSCSFP